MDNIYKILIICIIMIVLAWLYKNTDSGVNTVIPTEDVIGGAMDGSKKNEKFGCKYA